MSIRIPYLSILNGCTFLLINLSFSFQILKEIISDVHKGIWWDVYLFIHAPKDFLLGAYHLFPVFVNSKWMPFPRRIKLIWNKFFMVTDLKDGLKEAWSFLHKDLSIALPFYLYRIYLIPQLVNDLNHNKQYCKNYRNLFGGRIKYQHKL